MPRVHAIISTHTTRHLRRTLLAVLSQSRKPDSVIVTCDTDDPAIADLVAEVAQQRAMPITLIQRPHQGESRSSQVRNNAVRVALKMPHGPDDILWFLDGDCFPAHDCLEQHCELCFARVKEQRRGVVFWAKGPTVYNYPRRLVIGFRIDLTPEQTDAIDESLIVTGRPAVQPTPQQLAALRRRAARYRRHCFFRSIGFVKSHKPKLLSANFTLRLRDFIDVNGFDEEYVGYGQEDDDLGRRLYLAGVQPALAILEARTYHQYHETRAPGDWNDSPNIERFKREYGMRSHFGVLNPLPQPEPVVTRFGPVVVRLTTKTDVPAT